MKAESNSIVNKRLERIFRQFNQLRADLLGRGMLAEKLRRITQEVVAIFHADLAGIWLVHPGDLCSAGCVHMTADGIPKACQNDKRCLHLIADSGNFPRTDSKNQRRIPFGLGPLGSVISGADAKLISNDFSEDAVGLESDWARSLNLKALAAYRLMSHEKKPIGVLGCFSSRAINPDQDALLEGLSIMTEQFIWIENDLMTLRDSEKKYRDLFENISDFLYTHDLEGNFIEMNPAAQKTFGRREDDSATLNIKGIMPERYQKEFNAYIENILQQKKNEGIIRLFAKDGSEHIVEFKNSIIESSAGPVGIRGSARDITESVRDKIELAKSEERFQQVVENAQEWVWEMDASGLYTYANAAVEKILGYTPQEIAYIKYFYDFFLPEEREAFQGYAFNSFRQKEKFRDRIYRNAHKNGEIVWLSTSGVPILDDKGTMIGYRGVTADITQQKKTESELMQLSYFDGLTGIANRRYFEDIAGREWRRAVREGNPLSLLMVDIDFFKNYNDGYGHLAGDECLRKVAISLKQLLKRPADMIARFGGEEFVILLPDTGAKSATALAETLRSRIEDLGIEHSESYVSDVVTISVGVACVLPSENIAMAILIANADRALYRAKKAGRNRVGTVDLRISTIRD